MMKRTTERKWHSWLNGVVQTTCPSMWVRQRLLWTSGETLVTTPHWPSTARLWRESTALNSWGCTSQRTSPGPPTLHHYPRRRNSTYTFSAGWKEQVSLHPLSPFSTGEPLRARWPAASLSGTGTVVQQTTRPSSRQWTQLQRSSVPLSPASWTFSLHDAPVKLPISWRTPHIPPTVSSSSYHQEDGTGASEPTPPDCSTVFTEGLNTTVLNERTFIFIVCWGSTDVLLVDNQGVDPARAWWSDAEWKSFSGVTAVEATQP